MKGRVSNALLVLVLVAVLTAVPAIVACAAAPVAVDDSVSFQKNAWADIDVLANDTDADGDTLTITSVGATSSGGMALISTSGTKQVISYVAPYEYLGRDNFTYTISDGKGGTSTATVTVNLVAHLPPSAVADAASTPVNLGTDIYVLDNDVDQSFSGISIQSVTNPAQGGFASVVNYGFGELIHYDPPLGFSGTDTFFYTIVDGYGATATARVTVTVKSTIRIDSFNVVPSMVAAGASVKVVASVTPGDYPVTGVTANGVNMTYVAAMDDWEVTLTAPTQIGLHYITIQAADSYGNSDSQWAWYQVSRVVYTNIKSMRHPIMQNAQSSYLFALSGTVTVIDDTNFWLSNGADAIQVTCPYEAHGLTTGQRVRVQGVWYPGSDMLFVADRSSIKAL